VTVLDTSAVVDYLLGIGVAKRVEQMMATESELAAPDLLTFEVLAVLRRETFRQEVSEDRAAGAVEDLGDLPIELFGSLPLRRRAWALRRNFTTADALFIALAELLSEPLATTDSALAAEAAKHSEVTVIEL
jgi:predicted nucleic acid-binding protein